MSEGVKKRGLPGMTKKDLAEAAGTSYEWLRRVNKELPEGRKLFEAREDGGYDLAIFVQRWVEFNVNTVSDVNGMDLDTVRARHEAVKMQKTKLQVAQMRGEVADIRDIKKLWVTVATTVSRRLLNLPSRMAAELAEKKSAPEIERTLDEAIREELEALAETPVPDYAAAIDQADEEQSEEE